MIRSMSRLALVLLLLAWPVAAAQGGHGHGAHGDAPAGSPMGGSPGSMPMGGGPMGGPMAGAMDDAMHALPADELGFLQHMIPHHAEAVASAERLLTLTERPELQALLRDVIAVQSEEIERMRGWIAAWYPGEPDTAPYTPMMRDLADAPIAEQERAWLEDMVMHHMMAVRDARYLLARGLAVHPEVAEFALDVVAEQAREIALMRGWLASWFPGAGGRGMAMGGGMGMMGSMPMGMGAMHGRGDGAMGTMGAMGRMGMGGMGMRGMGGMHGHGGGMGMRGMGGMGMGAMHGRVAAATFDATTVEALARAFLAGAGGGEVGELHGPTVTFHVTVVVDGAERALVVDAATGEVRWADER